MRKNPPPPPANLRISFVSPSELHFCWDRPPLKGTESDEERILLGYEVFYQVNKTKPKRRLLDAFTNTYAVRATPFSECWLQLGSDRETAAGLARAARVQRFRSAPRADHSFTIKVRGLTQGTLVEKISVKARNTWGWGIPTHAPGTARVERTARGRGAGKRAPCGSRRAGSAARRW